MGTETVGPVMRGFVAFLTVLAMTIAVVPGAAAAQPDGACAPPDTATGSDGKVEPGQQLAGVLGEQQSAVEGEIDDRGFEARLDDATSDRERAKVIAAELKAIVERLVTLEETCEKLTSRLDADEIGEGTYRTRMGLLDARVDTVSCRLNRTEAAAAELPSDLRDEYGINETAFETVRERVERLDSFVSDAAGSAGAEPASTTTTGTDGGATTTGIGSVGASAGESVDTAGGSPPSCGDESQGDAGTSPLPW